MSQRDDYRAITFFSSDMFHDASTSSTWATVGRSSSHLLLITTSHSVCLPRWRIMRWSDCWLGTLLGRCWCTVTHGNESALEVRWNRAASFSFRWLLSVQDASVVVFRIGGGIKTTLGISVTSRIFFYWILSQSQTDVFDQDWPRLSQHCNDTVITERNPGAVVLQLRVHLFF